MKLICILLAVAYILWPIDLIPDVIPILGWIDDLMALGLAGTMLLKN